MSLESLEDLKNLFPAEGLMKSSLIFNRAFQTFDSAFWARSTGSAVVMIWAALDTLFQPTKGATTKEMAKMIAIWLHERGPARDKQFQRVKLLYESRSGVVHRSEIPEVEHFLESSALARLCFMRCLQLNRVPERDALLKQW